jgi:hypothetical protein
MHGISTRRTAKITVTAIFGTDGEQKFRFCQHPNDKLRSGQLAEERAADGTK